ncbi:hypothetical protein LSAT2_006124 [Lamellibrachia satsuma]|nr:hypothetical protein LSAT2_006124 [Lamellibrachia satsuma]
MARRRRRWKDVVPYCRCMCLSDRRHHKCPLAEEENDMETKADNMVEVEEEEEEVGFHQVAPPGDMVNISRTNDMMLANPSGVSAMRLVCQP